MSIVTILRDGVEVEIDQGDVWTAADLKPTNRVPPMATAAQCKIALYEAGHLEAVETKIANHPYAPVRIWYANANNWERDNAYVRALGAEIGLTDKAVDSLFQAAALKV